MSSKRAELEQVITEEFARKLAEQNLILVDFVLRNISFSEAYAQAVERTNSGTAGATGAIRGRTAQAGS